MVSARTGGIAVALGLGYAVVAGAGVASAEPSDGASDSASSSSSSSGSESSASPANESASSTATSSATGSPTHTTSDDKTSPATTGTVGEADKTDDADRRKPTTAPHERTAPGVTSSSTEREPEKNDETGAEKEPAAPEPEAQVPAETVTASDPEPSLEPSEPVATATSEPDADSPAAPADSPATWALAAAARRELTAPETSTADTADQGSSPIVAAAPPAGPVIAIEQIAPLEFLQHLPVLGPVVITPIVTLLHQIPVVGDVLHPYIGYPVQWGLPPGAPRPRDVRVISSDGTSIYVHFMPSTTFDADGRAPTVLNGPGLGLPGATNLDGTFLDPILLDTVGMLSPGILRRAGYNVVTWDPRGEWNSGGTLELNAADYEARDMSAIISWIATQPEARIDAVGDPRLGMVGVSYGGGIQLVTAANDTRVDAIVPAITYNRLDSSLYKRDAFKSSWATPLTAVLTVLGGRINPRILPATLYGDLTGDLSPEDLALFLSRNPEIAKIAVPTLIIHGTVDNLFSLAEADATAQTLLANGVPTKVVWFCGGHGVCANNLFDLSDGALIEQRTLAWLDRYVKLDPTAATGPQFEWVDQRGQWYSAATYPPVDRTSGTSVVAASSGQSTLPLIPYLGGSGFPFVPYALPALNAVNLTVPAATTTTRLVGAPKLTLTYSGTGTAEHVYAQLVDNSTGLILGAIVTPIPVDLDGESHTITVDLEPISHTLRPGETVTLQLVSSAGLYETILPSTGTLTVTGMQVSLPTL